MIIGAGSLHLGIDGVGTPGVGSAGVVTGVGLVVLVDTVALAEGLTYQAIGSALGVGAAGDGLVGLIVVAGVVGVRIAGVTIGVTTGIVGVN